MKLLAAGAAVAGQPLIFGFSYPPMLSATIAQLLLDTGAVQLRPEAPFTWASGWRSPIYCDNRLLLSYPVARTQVRDALVALARQHFAQAGAIAGVATAGIPQGALMAQEMELPFLYVRAKAKEHGRGNQVEGRIVATQPVLVVEDLISTGGSSLAACQALRTEGATVAGMVAIFSYGFAQATQAFAQAGVELHILCTYAELIAEAGRREAFTDNQLLALAAWRESPASWGKD